MLPPPHLKTLTYSSGERKPSLFLSAASKAENYFVSLIIKPPSPQPSLPLISSPSFLLLTPFFTIKLIGALEEGDITL